MYQLCKREATAAIQSAYPFLITINISTYDGKELSLYIWLIDIFKQEQEEYEKEGIRWEKISFTDNQRCIELIENRPIGILSLLEEECRFPKGTDLTLKAKLDQAFLDKSEYYAKPEKQKEEAFRINHYAAQVPFSPQLLLQLFI